MEDIGSDLVLECVTFPSIGRAVNKEVVDSFIPQVLESIQTICIAIQG